MTLRRHGDGTLRGEIEVLLTRIRDDLSETLVGTQSLVGGIHVRQYGTRRFVEQPQAWWEDEGFVVTAPPLLEEARRLSRAAREASPVGEW